MVDRDVAACGPVLRQSQCRLVQAAGAERAAYDSEQEAAGRHAYGLAPRTAAPGTALCSEHRLAKRCPCHDLVREAGRLEGDCALAGKARHEPVGRAGHGVIAHHHQRNPQHDGSGRTGKTRVSPHSDDDLWPATNKQPQSQNARDEEAADGADVLERQASLDAPSGQERDLETGLGHERGFHPAPRTHEPHRRAVVAAGHQRFADCQRGLDVASGASTGEERKGACRAVLQRRHAPILRPSLHSGAVRSRTAVRPPPARGPRRIRRRR